MVSVLFSEPKIPQFRKIRWLVWDRDGFSALQRAENSSIQRALRRALQTVRFSALQRAENSSICVFFKLLVTVWARFSALQRAENSSIQWLAPFCFSYALRFSALQRAENSSMFPSPSAQTTAPTFQCSSASRKFLNPDLNDVPIGTIVSFQCSSASRKFLNHYTKGHDNDCSTVSVLFSEPKIPQYDTARWRRARQSRFSALQRAENSSIPIPRWASQKNFGVSVLFSEPKIPQLFLGADEFFYNLCFSALQRAENSSITGAPGPDCATACGFSALQRAENSSIWGYTIGEKRMRSFSALQRAENSSIGVGVLVGVDVGVVSVLFSEPKIPQWTQINAKVYLICVSVLFSEPKIPQYNRQFPFQCRVLVSVLFSEPKIPQF